MQDRMISAALLLLLHVGAYFQADDAIMREIPGSHPYLTGLGILGGMYSFENPLQGECVRVPQNLCQHSANQHALKAHRVAFNSYSTLKCHTIIVCKQPIGRQIV